MTTRLLIALVTFASCAPSQRPFPQRDVMWADPDMVPFAPRPAGYESPEVWNTIDNTLFEPLVGVLSVDRIRRAPNVNALDEVPDSSWFTNRIDSLVRDPHAFARGPCKDPPPDPEGPWTVIAGKPNGVTPGFRVEHASGRRYLFKLDSGRQGERSSTADVIGSRLYYAAGYHAPCNEVVYLDPATLKISPKATAKDFVGDKVPFTQAMLDAALARGIKRADGKVRGSLSLLLDGALGPWRDFGTRDDDPNDVIPHEDRRELRGSYVFGAWISHYDAREQNTLDVWVDTGGGAGFIRHYMLDFSDSLGSLSSRPRVAPRRGHAYELEWPLAFIELVTLGAIDRPWRDPRPIRAPSTFGYFNVEDFSPDHYRTAYPFGPYSRVTEADAAWGGRLLARMSPSLVRAVIAEAQLSDPTVAAELEHVLLGRRDKLLRRYLGRLSPLTRPRIDEHGQLCVTDARREAGLEPGPLERCTAISAGATYRIVDLPSPPAAPLRVHLVRSGLAYKIVGVERDQ